MQFFDPVVQLILSQTQVVQEAEHIAAELTHVDWNTMFMLKEREVANTGRQPRANAEVFGVCQLCLRTRLAKRELLAHLKTCLQQQGPLRSHAKSQMSPKFLLLVEGSNLPEYWAYIEVGRERHLHTLDEILRNTWLECCGHLSAFTIGNKRYESHDDTDEGRNPLKANGMEEVLEQVLEPGMVFSYQYDFGSSTHLTLCVVDTYERKSFKGKSFPVLACNVPPVISCSLCGRFATRVCPQCRERDSPGGRGWYCRRCAKQHKCGEKTMLPVRNSPRVGVCCYTGRAYRLSHDDF